MSDSVTVSSPSHVFGLLRALMTNGVHLIDLSDGQKLRFPTDLPAVGLSLTPPPKLKRKPGMGFAPLAEPGELCMPTKIEIDAVLYLQEGVPIPGFGVDTGIHGKRRKPRKTEVDNAEVNTAPEVDTPEVDNAEVNTAPEVDTPEVDNAEVDLTFLVFIRIGDDNSLSRWEKIMQKVTDEYDKNKPTDCPQIMVVIRSTSQPLSSKKKARLTINCGPDSGKEE